MSRSSIDPQAQYKRELFVKVLQEDFIRELIFALDAVQGRAKPRAGFIEKLVNQFKEAFNFIPGTPRAATQVIDIFGNLLISHNRQNREKRLRLLATAAVQIQLPALKILLNIVAREALRRYEPFIVTRLGDDHEKSVITFARVGSRRMLEYLSRPTAVKKEDLEISESVLLTGLVKGKSGAWVDGFSNHKLALKNEFKEVDAETVYARPRFRYFSIGFPDGKIYPAQIDQLFIKKDDKEVYTEFEKKGSLDPKAGFVLMPLAEIKGYDFLKVEDKDKDKIFSSSLQQELKSSPVTIVVIDKCTIEAFLDPRASNQMNQMSLLTYVRQQANLPYLELLICHEDLSELKAPNGAALDLKSVFIGRDFSYVDFSGAILKGNFERVKFDHCYLVGAIIETGSSMRETSFEESHCEYLQAPNIDFTNARFVKTNFSCANLEGSTLVGCTDRGAVWINTNLTRAIHHDAAMQAKQRTQLMELEKEIADEKTKRIEFKDSITKRISDLEGLMQGGKLKEEKIQNRIGELVEQQQAHLIFENCCREEIMAIKKKLEDKPEKNIVDNLRTQLQETQSQLVRIHSEGEIQRHQLLNYIEEKHSGLQVDIKQQIQSLVSQQAIVQNGDIKALVNETTKTISKADLKADLFEIKTLFLDPEINRLKFQTDCKLIAVALLLIGAQSRPNLIIKPAVVLLVCAFIILYCKNWYSRRANVESNIPRIPASTFISSRLSQPSPQEQSASPRPKRD